MMGATYKGDVIRHRSLNENLPSLDESFPRNGKRFGTPSKSSKRVSIIESEDPLKTAKEFYGKISSGGIEKYLGDNKWATTLRDGTIITYRIYSKSGGPAVDINIRKSNEPTTIEGHKIHFVKGEKK